MADILIKQFRVRYQKQKYGPGSVIYDVPDELAQKLVKESNGTIDFLPGRGKAAASRGEVYEVDKVYEVDEVGEVHEVYEVGGKGLPPVSPEATIK